MEIDVFNLLIDINGMSTQVGLFYAYRLGDHVDCIFIFTRTHKHTHKYICIYIFAALIHYIYIYMYIYIYV